MHLDGVGDSVFGSVDIGKLVTDVGLYRGVGQPVVLEPVAGPVLEQGMVEGFRPLPSDRDLTGRRPFAVPKEGIPDSRVVWLHLVAA
ncbi:hypothetical protein, partial [Nocardia sp. 852002-51244_SCH5132740]|uniref:hypothetical protein n=1 Tax=Nocardia sp. 852002-51244_SCH5132740 TaxID=1834099 RepID=UPI001E63E107